jgi:hypothetical protein
VFSFQLDFSFAKLIAANAEQLLSDTKKCVEQGT